MFKFLMLVWAFFSGCDTRDLSSVEMIKKEKYDDVVLTGIDWSKCRAGDKVADEFKGIDKNGKTVTGIVCGGNSLLPPQIYINQKD